MTLITIYKVTKMNDTSDFEGCLPEFVLCKMLPKIQNHLPVTGKK